MAYVIVFAALTALTLSAFAGLIVALTLVQAGRIKGRRKKKTKTIGQVLSYAEACDAVLARRIERAAKMEKHYKRLNRRRAGINWGAR